MSSIYCLLDYPIISWAQIADQMRTASYFFRKTFPPNIWINSKFSNFLQIFLISAASSLLTGEESKCATHSYHLLQICHFLNFSETFSHFRKEMYLPPKKLRLHISLWRIPFPISHKIVLAKIIFHISWWRIDVCNPLKCCYWTFYKWFFFIFL